MKKKSIKWRMFLLILLGHTTCFGQGRPGYDSSYYQVFKDRITGRFYFSKKYTSFDLLGEKGQTLHYRPNTTLNMGVGATFKFISINLAYGFKFLNDFNDPKGETKYLDMQSHVYRQKFTIDLLGQFYEGYYLRPKGTAASSADVYYQRPDIDVVQTGIAAYYIFNWKKFSFQAAMLQNEWQKKSAGTVLLGAESYYGQIEGDSVLVPYVVQSEYPQKEVSELRYYNFGLGAGYAYTLVIARHFYLLANINGTVSVNFSRENNRVGYGKNDAGIVFSPLYRAGAGYSSDRWIVAFLWVNSSIGMNAYYGKYRNSTGNTRIMLAYRFNNFLKRSDK